MHICVIRPQCVILLVLRLQCCQFGAKNVTWDLKIKHEFERKFPNFFGLSGKKTGMRLEIEGELCQYHDCWCPCLHPQVISNHSIGHEGQTGPGLPWGRISTTSAISVSRNDRKCKCEFAFSQKNSAYEGLPQWLQLPLRHWCLDWIAHMSHRTY